MTIDRSRLLEAAARVYGEFGFRGATTRRIADVAQVNEITLFRHFGSKESLIDEALRNSMGDWRLPPLPDVPQDPLAELTSWCTAVLDHLRRHRGLIRRVMSERDERPAVAPCAGTGPIRAAQELRRYVERLPRPDGAATAISMLMAALFADAMGRELMPAMYPQPADRAAAAYVVLFLRALGAETLSPVSGNGAEHP